MVLFRSSTVKNNTWLALACAMLNKKNPSHFNQIQFNLFEFSAIVFVHVQLLYILYEEIW